MPRGLLARRRQTSDSKATITPSVTDRTNSRPMASQRKRLHQDLTDNLSICGQQQPRGDVLLPTGPPVGGGGGCSEEEGRNDDDDHSGSDSRDETESDDDQSGSDSRDDTESSSSNDAAAATSTQKKQNGGLGLSGSGTGSFDLALLLRKRKCIDDMPLDWKYDGVHSARGKEDFGKGSAEFNCAPSMQTARTAEESYPSRPKVGSVADLPSFGIHVGEAILQPGQALQQQQGHFYIFYRMIAGFVRVKLESSDGKRRQEAVSHFTATCGTMWFVPSGDTSLLVNCYDYLADIGFTRFLGSVGCSAAPGTTAAA